jgi:hypothetical protein
VPSEPPRAGRCGHPIVANAVASLVVRPVRKQFSRRHDRGRLPLGDSTSAAAPAETRAGVAKRACGRRARGCCDGIRAGPVAAGR